MRACQRFASILIRNKGLFSQKKSGHFPPSPQRVNFVTTRVTGAKKPFSRFPVPEVDSLPKDLQERVKEVKEKFGFIPNVFSALSYRPNEMRAFFDYLDCLMDDRGNLTKADKEMIVVATSAENNCFYCIVARGALHRIFSRNAVLADQLAANWRAAEIDERQRAILDFAMDVCHARQIPEEKFVKLRDHGFTDDDIWDIGAITALFALGNRMAYLTNLKPNAEFHTMGRVK